MSRGCEKDPPDLGPPTPIAAWLFSEWLQARPPVVAPAKKPPKGLRILVAADHEATRKAFSLTLAPICDVVYMAETGAKALRALETTRFDLVFIDVHMAEMGGVQAACGLRDREPAGSHTPVVAIAGRLSDRDREACILAGMDGFAETPIEAGKLIALAMQVLAQAKAVVRAA